MQQPVLLSAETVTIPDGSGHAPHSIRTWRFELYDEIGSTSDLCKERAESGEPEGLAVLALKQTKGRGSRGRQWSDPGDSLALSVLLRPDPQVDVLPALWPFLFALAFRDGLVSSCPDAEDLLKLKWPNDILLHGRKLAGLLIERGGSDSGSWLVAGLGANLARAPRIDGRDLAALRECGSIPDRDVVARNILCALTHWLAVMAEKGFAPIRSAWIRHALAEGTRLVAQSGNTYIEGEFAGIDEVGALILRTADGPKRIATAEVFLMSGKE